MLHRLLNAAAACIGLAAASVCGQTPSSEMPIDSPVEYVARRLPEVLPEAEPTESLTLEDVEAIALTTHPTLAAAANRVRAARYHCWQVGRPPNPQIGLQSVEIGNDGAAGQHGILASQQYVRGGKLQLNQAVARREASRLEQELAAQQSRVLTDVRTAFFDTYLAQRKLDLAANLVAVSEQAVSTARALLQAQEGRRTDLVQAEIENRRAALDRIAAESELRSNWRKLAAAAGQPSLTEAQLDADLESLSWQLSWEESVAQLVRESPEIAAAVARVEKARWTLARERAEPIPDVYTQLAVQYDDSTSDAIASAQMTLPIPLWNRNSGGICRAQAEVAAAQRMLESKELELGQRMAEAFQNYEIARARVDSLRTDILPRAEQNLQLVTQGYQAGEIGFLDFLTVQRTYFQTNLEFLAALRDLNQTVQLLSGNLLANAFSTEFQAD